MKIKNTFNSGLLIGAIVTGLIYSIAIFYIVTKLT